MSYEALDASIKRSVSSGGARTLLMVLAHHADRFGKNAYPSLRTLMAEANQSERQVRYNLATLVGLGEVLRDERAGPGLANIYEITLVQNSVDNASEGSQVGQPVAPVNKEDAGEVGQCIAEGGAISGMQVGQSIAPKHTVKGQEDSRVVGEARAQGEKVRTTRAVPKSQSARRGAHHSQEEPKEIAPAAIAPPGEELADIEALRADPVLIAMAEGAAELMGQRLDTLTAAQAGALREYRQRWNGQITPAMVADTKRKVQLQGARIEVPAAYFMAALDGIATRPRASPSSGPSGTGRGKPANSQGLDPANYAPGGKWGTLFNGPGEAKIIKVIGGDRSGE